jgi:galactose mutarotase-like enzyme
MSSRNAWVSIGSGEFSAKIDPLGAQLSSLQDSGSRELLWHGDPAIWAGRAPLLFPIVGVLAGGSYRYGSQRYALRRHGFARGKNFTIERVTAATAVFKLRDDATTLAVYPFRFELTVHFDVSRAALTVNTLIRNLGDTDMPASFGYHPGFCWPLPFAQPRSGHFIEFESDEPADARRIDSQGLLLPAGVASPVVNRRLALKDALFQDDVLIFDQVKSRSVIYGSEQGPKLRLEFPDAPYLGVWSKPAAPFVCIEPWHGITDAQGFAGDFIDKPGVFIVKPGATFSSKIVITLLRAWGRLPLAESVRDLSMPFAPPER